MPLGLLPHHVDLATCVWMLKNTQYGEMNPYPDTHNLTTRPLDHSTPIGWAIFKKRNVSHMFTWSTRCTSVRIHQGGATWMIATEMMLFYSLGYYFAWEKWGLGDL